MIRYLLFALLAAALAAGVFLFTRDRGYPADEHSLAQGEQLFSLNCSSCHALESEGFGPPLGGVTELFSEKSLIQFIKNPSKAIESGEERATKLHERYKQIMPPFERLADAEIRNILSYIHSQTELHHILPFSMDNGTEVKGLTGRLVDPVIRSGLKIELEEVVQIPRLPGSSPDLGIVTLRPHPAANGVVFVSDQNGYIYRIHNGKAEVFLDARKHIPDFQSGPGIATGIASFEFHPDFLQNGLFYMLHAETFKGKIADYSVLVDTFKSEVQWVVAEWKMDNVNDSLFRGTHRELLRLHAPTFGHGAQDMGFIPGLKKGDPEYGLLYFGFGDGGANNIKHPEIGHRLTAFLGSIMRIDPAGNNSKNGKYGIPVSNPFVNETDPLTVKEIYAYGFRNPHRFSWDQTHNNRMIASDIGEANIEEVNVIEKGGDYGWPSREGTYGITTTRDLKTVYQLPEIDRKLYKLPFAQFDHEEGNAISGGYVYDGDLTQLKDKYIFGDIVSGRLFFVNVDPMMTDSSVYELSIFQDGKETSLREMSQTKRIHLRIGYDRFAKQLYVITKVDGKIYRVSNAAKISEAN
ncbi:MAG: PQQ-dependent sugar dehydrogenase [Bacteroidia bacterium]